MSIILLFIGGFMTYDGVERMDSIVKPSTVAETVVGTVLLLLGLIIFIFGDEDA